MIRKSAFFLPFLTLLATSATAQSLTETEIPCQGTISFSEDFEAGIPSSWTIWDADGRTPQSGIGLVAGWQPLEDYQNNANHVAASPSWYSPTGASDDWLVTPSIALPANPCLSWNASSVDESYPEAYEVRIATGTDSASLVASVVVDTVSEENEAWTTHSLHLGAYAGTNVFIAFHQISDDKFVLALDDVKVTNIKDTDIGVWSLDEVTADPGDTVFLAGRIMNYGTDTLRSFTVSFQVEGGLVFSTTIDTVAISLNNGADFVMGNSWITDTLPRIYDVCVFTTLPNAVADQDITNDSLCTEINIGGAISVDPSTGHQVVEVFPNPSHGRFVVRVPEGAWTMVIYALDGRRMREITFFGAEYEVEMTGNGLHLIRLENLNNGAVVHGKVILH